MIEILIYVSSALIVLIFPTIYFYKYQKHSRRAREKLQQSIARGLTEPVSLHPKIDPTRCIDTGACVSACPEGEILGIVDGRATLVSPTKCIGHGACEAACPVEAITLVFGTERRGVEIPYVKHNFETNVPGIYIAGELGGMGLIRNAVTQGRQAVRYIQESLKSSYPDVFDVAVIGAGPAGLAASLQAQMDGLKFVTLEQDEIGGTILNYPRQKLVMTQPMEIPLYGKVKFREILKEDLLGLWHDIIERTQIEINTRERVENIERNDGFYKIISSKGEYYAQRVVLAIGRRGSPRKLGVPGEKSSKVAYRLIEPEQYIKKKLLVVGGGDSAVEAALALSEQKGTEVFLSYRRGAFTRIKEKNLERIERAAEDGRVQVLLESHVKEIKREEVLIEQKGNLVTIPNDYVFIFIGGTLPTEFLKKIGISIEKKFGQR
ncbi:MAG: 4Fe-4S dicluster domain-containing protein [Calditrichaeota bacterium]|nr:MAG: 4Fe-4S dicluster domain-containing protein [Calditrichota bacterium]